MAKKESGEDFTWSPNGQWIAWISRIANSPLPFTKSLYLMDTQCLGDLENCIDQSMSLDKTAWVAPKWSWEGKLATSCIKEGMHGICVVDVEKDKSLNMVVDIDQLTPKNEMLLDLDWSSDGKYLVFTVRYGDVAVGPTPKDAYTDVWIVSAQGGTPTNLTNTPDQDEWSNGWSPDDEYVAYSRSFGLEPLPKWEGAYAFISDIYIVPSVGGDSKNLTKTPNQREDFVFWMVFPNKFAPGFWKRE